MKHQYFGDVNDFRKYGLLHGLTGQGSLQTGVCWMLTEGDQRSDGGMVGYLDKADEFRAFVPDLFDFLRECVHVKRARHISNIEKSGFLPSAVFFSDLLTDDRQAREVYFERMLCTFANVDLIFFDPDNGFEVPSKPLGRKDSSKYLFWHEFEASVNAAHSVLVYQHFPRAHRDRFVKRLAAAMMQWPEVDLVFAFRTPRVVFLLASQAKHSQHFNTQAEIISRQWGERHIVVRKYHRRRPVAR
jgi:hypothetical protein